MNPRYPWVQFRGAKKLYATCDFLGPEGGLFLDVFFLKSAQYLSSLGGGCKSANAGYFFQGFFLSQSGSPEKFGLSCLQNDSLPSSRAFFETWI
mgnify:CR=1 FL=1